MAMAAAADAFIDLVDPYCSIAKTLEQAATASSDIPAPSWPNSNTHSRGSLALSKDCEFFTLSIPIISIPALSNQALKSAISG